MKSGDWFDRSAPDRITHPFGAMWHDRCPWTIGELLTRPDRSYEMSTFLWITLVALYLVALVSLGLATLRNGHVWLFVIGIFFPLLWIVGAMMSPSPRATGAG